MKVYFPDAIDEELRWSEGLQRSPEPGEHHDPGISTGLGGSLRHRDLESGRNVQGLAQGSRSWFANDASGALGTHLRR